MKASTIVLKLLYRRVDVRNLPKFKLLIVHELGGKKHIALAEQLVINSVLDLHS